MTDKKIGRDLMAETTDVFIPKVPGEAEALFASVGGVNYLLPRGKTSRVPVALARVLEEAQRMQAYAEDFAAQERRKMDAVQGAPM